MAYYRPFGRSTVKFRSYKKPWAYIICSKDFLLGLFSGEPIFGEAYYWKGFCISGGLLSEYKGILLMSF